MIKKGESKKIVRKNGESFDKKRREIDFHDQCGSETWNGWNGTDCFNYNKNNKTCTYGLQQLKSKNIKERSCKGALALLITRKYYLLYHTNVAATYTWVHPTGFIGCKGPYIHFVYNKIILEKKCCQHAKSIQKPKET